MKEINNKDIDPESLYPHDLAHMANTKLEELADCYRDIPRELERPIRYCLLSGGKRIRPVLAMASAASLGKDPDYVLPIACAIEFIHSYSLIHDDLPAIDDDDLRRGKPSCHRKFGEDIAILTGDALFAEAFNIILGKQQGTPARLIKAMREIAEASGASGMVAGQVIDVSASRHRISRERLEEMHTNKTARLITASITAPAILCGAKKKVLEKYREYGINIGLAFQITDDILDITSSSMVTGKTAGKDKAQAKNTYPLLWGIERSRKIAAEKIHKALEALEQSGTDNLLMKNIAQFILIRRS
jgi:geranylgeranyl diphosphate synthase, type II